MAAWGELFALGDVEVQSPGGVDPTQLPPQASEVVEVGGRERWSGVDHQSPRRISGHGDGLTHLTLEALLRLGVQHRRVDDALAGPIDTDQQRPLLPGNEDGLGVEAQHPTPEGANAAETPRGAMEAAPYTHRLRVIAEIGRPRHRPSSVSKVRNDTKPCTLSRTASTVTSSLKLPPRRAVVRVDMKLRP